jgi:uncharacterized protein YjbI with pentapeptide repeats
MSSKSLYETLEIRPDASPEVIKAAYRTLSAKFHPDRDSSAAASLRFVEIQEAYEVLSDEVRRREYDRILDAGSVPNVESVAVLRTDGTSTFLTLREHQRRGWQEAASCDLSNHDFSGISFENAKLNGAKLDGSRFHDCSFRRADLTGCIAIGCQFDQVEFSGAKLANSDFTKSSFRHTKFFSIGPVWRSEHLEDKLRFSINDGSRTRITEERQEMTTILEKVNFSDCNLTDAMFSAPPFVDTRKSRVVHSFGTAKEIPFWDRQTFANAQLRDCTFLKAALLRCRFTTMKLQGSNFDSADLRQADMRNCDISRLDLSRANLIDTNLTGCRYSDDTKFPDGYSLPTGARNLDTERRKENEEGSDQFLLAIGLLLTLILVLLVFSVVLAS